MASGGTDTSTGVRAKRKRLGKRVVTVFPKFEFCYECVHGFLRRQLKVCKHVTVAGFRAIVGGGSRFYIDLAHDNIHAWCFSVAACSVVVVVVVVAVVFFFGSDEQKKEEKVSDAMQKKSVKNKKGMRLFIYVWMWFLCTIRFSYSFLYAP